MKRSSPVLVETNLRDDIVSFWDEKRLQYVELKSEG